MIWALIVYTIGVFGTWSSRISDPEVLVDRNDLIVALGWPIFAIAFIAERLS